MHLLLAEIAAISVAFLSGGYFFRERLSAFPALQLLAGLVVVVATTTTLFEWYGSAAKGLSQYSRSLERQGEIDREKLAANEEQALNRELQNELIRLSCYRGVADGVWGERSRQALSDFLVSIGKEKEYGASVKVGDLRRLFRSAPNGTCAPTHPVNQAAAISRYRASHDRYVKECIDYFLLFPVERKTGACTSLKYDRDQHAARMGQMGIAAEAK